MMQDIGQNREGRTKGTAAFVALANIQSGVYCFSERKLANNLSLLAISSFVKTALRSKCACKMAIISEFIERLFCLASLRSKLASVSSNLTVCWYRYFNIMPFVFLNSSKFDTNRKKHYDSHILNQFRGGR